MSAKLHESYAGEDARMPPERSTGLVFAAVALIVAWFWRDSTAVLWTAIGVAFALTALAFLMPALLRPLNIVWFRFGMLLHRVVNPLVMFVIFAAVFVPAGLLMRIWHDPLRRKRADGKASYWIARADEKPRTGSMTNQF